MSSEDNAVFSRDSTFSAVSLYGYTPDAWIGILLLVFFKVSTISHIVQTVHSRLWWLLPTICACGMLETIGWIGRVWSSYNLLLFIPYLMQFVCTTIAPVLFTAASFIMLEQCIRRLGQQYSRLSPRWYTTAIFCGYNVIALVVQVVGSSIASAAINSGKNSTFGCNVMLAGFTFQLVATTCYMIFAAEFMLRVLYDRPISRRLASPTSPAIYGLDRNIWQILSALIFSNLCVHVRLWYRIIELSDNSTGYLSRTQRYFVIMDALMIILAMLTVNLFHPGRLLARPGAQKGDVWKVDMILSSEENVSSLACIELASA